MTFVATVVGVGATGTAAQAATCQGHIGSTYKSGSSVVGFGSIDSACASGSKATLEIRRQVIPGLWSSVLASATVNGPGYDQYVSWNCTGQGTQTYRTQIRWKNPYTGSYDSKESTARFSC
ncbi:hypothetical protein [Catellatospora methionotrophica]|uniref:hypothetical protein n=1 Tax=Catellatospora methionotrophica TaxID=121620 RepID=UPI0033CFFF72